MSEDTVWEYQFPDGSIIKLCGVPETVEEKLRQLDRWCQQRCAPFKLQKAQAEFELLTGTPPGPC